MTYKENICTISVRGYNKVCKILDDVLANRPTERDSLIVAVRKAFEALELFGISEQLPSAQPETCEGCKHLGKWENEVEYGYPSPCTRCRRRVEDYYER